MKFKLLREKSVKGAYIKRYLVDPSPRELVAFTKKTEHKSLRIVYYNGVMYAFDANEYTHVGFLSKELFLDYGDALAHWNKSPEHSGAFSLVDDNNYYLYGLKPSSGVGGIHAKYREALKTYMKYPHA